MWPISCGARYQRGAAAHPPPSPLAITSVGIEAGPWALPGPWEGEGAGAVWPRGSSRPPRDLRVLGRLPSGAPSPADLWPLSVAGPAQHPPTPQVSELTHCCCSVPGCLDSAWCSWPMCLHWWAAGGSPSGLGPRARGQRAQGLPSRPLLSPMGPRPAQRELGREARPGSGLCCLLLPVPPTPTPQGPHPHQTLLGDLEPEPRGC